MNWRNNRRSGWKIGKQSSQRRLWDINLCNWAASLLQKSFFATTTRRKKVNLKWHVNVMRSHVKWNFLSTDVAKKMRRMLGWLSINVNFMWIYYVSIYVFCRSSTSGNLKSLSFLFLSSTEDAKVKANIQQSRKNVLKLNHSHCISEH